MTHRKLKVLKKNFEQFMQENGIVGGVLVYAMAEGPGMVWNCEQEDICELLEEKIKPAFIKKFGFPSHESFD